MGTYVAQHKRNGRYGDLSLKPRGCNSCNHKRINKHHIDCPWVESGHIMKFPSRSEPLTSVNTTTFYYERNRWCKIIQNFLYSFGCSNFNGCNWTSLSILLFKSTGGLRSKSMDFSAEGIDITNEESDEWKVMLDKAGMRSMEISGSGVYNNYPVFKH